MFKERLQVLVSAEQRRCLESEAQRRGTSVASLIREAVDVHFRRVSQADRLHALAGIRATRGRFLSPDELTRLVGDEHEGQLGALPQSGSR